MTKAEDRKKLVLYAVIALVAIGVAVVAAILTSQGTGETHRDLNDVPPKGAGKFRDKGDQNP